MREHFTIGFLIKSMDSHFQLEAAKLKTRRKKAEVEKRMVGKIKEISNAVKKLNEIVCICEDREDPMFLAATTLLKKIDTVYHILSSLNFAYRSDLENDP